MKLPAAFSILVRLSLQNMQKTVKKRMTCCVYMNKCNVERQKLPFPQLCPLCPTEDKVLYGTEEQTRQTYIRCECLEPHEHLLVQVHLLELLLGEELAHIVHHVLRVHDQVSQVHSIVVVVLQRVSNYRSCLSVSLDTLMQLVNILLGWMLRVLIRIRLDPDRFLSDSDPDHSLLNNPSHVIL
jgi:hypothetical protein